MDRVATDELEGRTARGAPASQASMLCDEARSTVSAAWPAAAGARPQDEAGHTLRALTYSYSCAEKGRRRWPSRGCRQPLPLANSDLQSVPTRPLLEVTQLLTSAMLGPPSPGAAAMCSAVFVMGARRLAVLRICLCLCWAGRSRVCGCHGNTQGCRCVQRRCARVSHSSGEEATCFSRRHTQQTVARLLAPSWESTASRTSPSRSKSCIARACSAAQEGRRRGDGVRLC